MKHARSLTFGLLLLASAAPAGAQSAFTTDDDDLPVSVYVEAGGNASWICCSANLDIRIARHVWLRAGKGAEVINDDSTPITSSIFMVKGTIGPPAHAVEIGAGLANRRMLDPPHTSRVGPAIQVGVRIRQTSGYVTRFTFTPLLRPFIGSATKRRFQPYFGISVGL